MIKLTSGKRVKMNRFKRELNVFKRYFLGYFIVLFFFTLVFTNVSYVLILVYGYIVYGSFSYDSAYLFIYFKLSIFVGFQVGFIYYIDYRFGTFVVVIYAIIFFAVTYLLTEDGQTMIKHFIG